ncbi:MAG: hypothetical protein ACYTKD_32130, partial [Planctomycetota bacterium]
MHRGLLAFSSLALLLPGCGKVGAPELPSYRIGPSQAAEVGADNNGEWGEAVNGLRCRLSIDRAKLRLGEQPKFRLELQNASSAPVNVSVEMRGYFGRITPDGGGREGWYPPVGKWIDSHRSLEPNGVISCTEFVPLGSFALPEGRHVLTGEYYNAFGQSDEAFHAYLAARAGTDVVRSKPIEVIVSGEDRTASSHNPRM